MWVFTSVGATDIGKHDSLTPLLRQWQSECSGGHRSLGGSRFFQPLLQLEFYPEAGEKKKDRLYSNTGSILKLSSW